MRIASVSEGEATGTLADAYESIRRELGRVTPAYQAMSLKPDYLAAFWALHSVVMAEGDLTRLEKEAIALAVSAANASEYSVVVHARRLRALGADDVTIEGLQETPETALRDRRGNAILRFALNVTRSSGAIREADVAALREIGLSDGAILEATAVAAHFNALNRFLDALGVRPPQA